MPISKSANKKSQSQSDKFKAMAVEIGADGDEKALDKALATLAQSSTEKKAKS